MLTTNKCVSWCLGGRPSLTGFQTGSATTNKAPICIMIIMIIIVCSITIKYDITWRNIVVWYDNSMIFTGYQTGSGQTFFVDYRSAINFHTDAIIMPSLYHNYGILRHFCKNIVCPDPVWKPVIHGISWLVH